MTLKKTQVKALKAFLEGLDVLHSVDEYCVAQLEIKQKDLEIIENLIKVLVEENQ